ncbi:hypothetical protein INR49_025027 [Caranx melampygus]|nr:hypothetical protein INR49_025027 [Caranx melampygus]
MPACHHTAVSSKCQRGNGATQLSLIEMTRSQSVRLHSGPYWRNTACLQRPTLQLCPAAQAALKIHRSTEEDFHEGGRCLKLLQETQQTGVKSQDEINAEQRLVLAADERKREFHEEKRNEFESYAEEEHDEQNERTRESTEQWREFHYDGMHPPHEYNRHSI